MSFFIDLETLFSRPTGILALISYIIVFIYLIIRAKKHIENNKINKREGKQLILDILIALLCITGQPLYLIPMLLSNWPKKIKLLVAIPMIIFLVITFMWGISPAN